MLCPCVVVLIRGHGGTAGMVFVLHPDLWPYEEALHPCPTEGVEYRLETFEQMMARLYTVVCPTPPSAAHHTWRKCSSSTSHHLSAGPGENTAHSSIRKAVYLVAVVSCQQMDHWLPELFELPRRHSTPPVREKGKQTEGNILLPTTPG